MHQRATDLIYNDDPAQASTFTPSSEYKRLITAICKMQELFTTIHASDTISTERKERHLFYVLRVDGDSISLYGYITYAAGTQHAHLTEIHPERDFYLKQNFWIGAPQHVFKDFDPVKDKKLGRLSWAATYDREPVSETFSVMLSEPVVMLTFNRSFVERWAEEAPTKIVDFSTTLDDLPKDIYPAGAAPYFGTSVAK